MFSAILGSQWFVKLLLILALLAVGYFILKPVKSAQHLAMRRLGMMIFIAFATVAVLFPTTLTRLAYWLNIGRGTDLLLYAVVLFFFSSVVTAYRRDASNEKKLTALARTLALNNVEYAPCDIIKAPELSGTAHEVSNTQLPASASAQAELGHSTKEAVQSQPGAAAHGRTPHKAQPGADQRDSED